MRISVCFILTLAFSNCLAQVMETAPAKDFAEIYTYAKEKTNLDQQLINGAYYEYKYKHAEGHPYLSENEFTQGDLVFRGTHYEGLSLKYDIHEQALILRSAFNNSHLTTKITEEFLTAFSLLDMHFEKRAFTSETPLFYQVVAETEDICCLYHWYKSRQESTHNETFFSYKFSEDKYTSYLLFSGKLVQFKNKRSYVQLFPEAIQQTLMSYLKTHKLKINKVSQEEMSEIIHYSQTLLKQNSSKE